MKKISNKDVAGAGFNSETKIHQERVTKGFEAVKCRFHTVGDLI